MNRPDDPMQLARERLNARSGANEGSEDHETESACHGPEKIEAMKRVLARMSIDQLNKVEAALDARLQTLRAGSPDN